MKNQNFLTIYKRELENVSPETQSAAMYLFNYDTKILSKEQAKVLAQYDGSFGRLFAQWGCPTFDHAGNPVIAEETI